MGATCKCISRIDELLKPHNTRLALTIEFGEQMPVYPTIMTEQIEKGRGKKKAVTMMPSYCPFCGTKYPEKQERAA